MVSRGQRKKTAGKGIAGRDPRTRSHVLECALEWFSQDCNFIDLALHGNVGWEPMQLIVLAVLWSWSERSTLTKAFEDAAQLAMRCLAASRSRRTKDSREPCGPTRDNCCPSCGRTPSG